MILSSAFCVALAHAVFAANDAQNRGVTLDQATAIVDELPADARTAGNDVLWYVYVSNSDKRLSSAKLSSIVLRACTIRENQQ